MRKYTIQTYIANTQLSSLVNAKTVTATSSLEALIDESTLWKKKGVSSFFIEVFSAKGQRLAILVR